VERWREITVDGICDMGDIPIERTVDALSNQLVATLDGLLDPGDRDREPAYRGLPNFKRDFIFDVVHSARDISCQILESVSDKFRVTRAAPDNYEVLGTYSFGLEMHCHTDSEFKTMIDGIETTRQSYMSLD
jgi:hypothetical protein